MSSLFFNYFHLGLSFRNVMKNFFNLKINRINNDFILMAKNRRIPNLANHGARPCSSYMRKLKWKPYNT